MTEVATENGQEMHVHCLGRRHRPEDERRDDAEAAGSCTRIAQNNSSSWCSSQAAVRPSGRTISAPTSESEVTP